MQKKERFERFINYFKAHQPDAQTELHYSNPYELLVAVILSAQCTDKRVNMTTPALFHRFPTPLALSKSSAEEVFEYIKSISFANNKSKFLVGMAKILVEKHHSIVPNDMEALQEMPGVGRKTANVITSVVFGEAAMAVDTHVFRVSKRIGLVTQTANTPLAVEKQLMKYIPEEYVHIAHHWLILHGRYICVARNPKCDICPLTDFCWYFSKNNK